MKTKIYIFMLIMIMCLPSCGERQSVSTVNTTANIDRDETIYFEDNEESEEKKAAKECWNYLSGNNGTTVDYFKAAEIIKPYENSDDPDVLYCLGFMHEMPAGLDYDVDLAKELLEKSELGGNYYASLYLGIIYEEGSKNIEYDYELARDYYRRAILNGVVEGYYGLAHLYASGHGMEKDVSTALHYYNKVINEGKDNYFITKSMRGIASLYSSGDKRDQSEEKDDPEYEKTIEWVEKAQSLGDPWATDWMAYYYERGRGVDKDIDKAIELYEKSAEQGLVYPMYYLGEVYAEGEDVKQDIDKALEWYQKAAEYNYPDALFAIGQIYDGGIGVEQDKTKAQEYYDKARAAGFED